MFSEICYLVVGAVGAVAADRVWRKIESRIRLDVVPCQLTVPDALGITFKITNRGSVPIPPFQISVHHPKRGSVFASTYNASNALLAGQTVEESFLVARVHAGPSSDEFFFRCVDGEPDDFWLMIKQRQSEDILFKSLREGNAFARVYRQMCKDRSFANVSGRQWKELCSTHVPWYKRPFRRWSTRQKPANVLIFSMPLNGPTGEMKCEIIKPEK